MQPPHRDNNEADGVASVFYAIIESAAGDRQVLELAAATYQEAFERMGRESLVAVTQSRILAELIARRVPASKVLPSP